jgi:hypothetical protein
MEESREVSTPDRQFTKSALTFYIEAARHALPATNLPQFADCIQAIARHRDCSSGETQEGMVEQYWALRNNERLYTRPLSAVKEFYFGLRGILEDASTASIRSQVPELSPSRKQFITPRAPSTSTREQRSERRMSFRTRSSTSLSGLNATKLQSAPPPRRSALVGNTKKT